MVNYGEGSAGGCEMSDFVKFTKSIYSSMTLVIKDFFLKQQNITFSPHYRN